MAVLVWLCSKLLRCFHALLNPHKPAASQNMIAMAGARCTPSMTCPACTQRAGVSCRHAGEARDMCTPMCTIEPIRCIETCRLMQRPQGAHGHCLQNAHPACSTGLHAQAWCGPNTSLPCSQHTAVTLVALNMSPAEVIAGGSHACCTLASNWLCIIRCMRAGITELFDSIQLIPASSGVDHHSAQKDKAHFPRIQKETGVPWSGMLFFDDESPNIAKVCTCLHLHEVH